MGCMFSKVAAKFAFFPPTPSTYQIINKSHDDNTTNNNNNVKKKKNLSVVSTTSIPSSVGDDNLCDVLLIDTKKGNKIVGFFLKNPYARLTLLYSHGNAADLGQLYDLFVQLKVNLRVNIMGYDYSGYGASTGKPSERNTYADIEAVYECLQTEYGISQEDLILYGQSVGSGPTLHLAAKLPRLRGIVLHSGILSGLRVLCHVNFSFCYDIYKNINKIKKVKCPVLVIHGTEDDVVNLLHGNKLWKMAREPYEPLWIKGGGHCNLELYPDYIRHLCRFIKEMEDTNTKTLLKKIWPNIRLKRRCRIACCNTSRKCCTVKLRRPRCSGCCSCTPSCVKCFSCRKFPNCCKFSCCNCGWWPKCSKCWRPSCCCGGSSKCWRPSCCCGGSSKCWRPSCCCGGSSKCWRSSCCCGGSVVKCLQPQCSCCYCGGGRRGNGKREGRR